MFFSDWNALLRTVAVGVPAYAALVLVLRVSGKRTLAKWSAFDSVVTIAIGSTLATVLLSRSTTLAQGLVALGLLVALQFVATWTSVRSRTVRRWLTSEPQLLIHHGRILHDARCRARVTEGELRVALRQHGCLDPGEVAALVLEADGSFSMIRQSVGRDAWALADVRGYPVARAEAAPAPGLEPAPA